MYIMAERKDEDVDPKKAMMKEAMGDSYIWENENNSFHDTKRAPEAEEEKNAWISWRSKKLWLVVALVTVMLAAVGTGVALASATHILHKLGFASTGLVSNSFASNLMSSTSQANNHTVPKDSWVSWLQKAGQKGLSSEHKAYLGTAGAICGALVAVMVMLVVVVVSVGARRCRRHSLKP